jgi:ribosomal protein S18 acetylase RimI-like enzyme
LQGMEPVNWEIRPIAADDRRWIVDLLTEKWGSPRIVTRGKVYQGDRLPGFVALRNEAAVGLITYRITGDSCEILTLNSLVETAGIGTGLITVVKREAESAGCRRLWLVTTNDNRAAVRFYENRGFIIATVHRGAMEESRKLKPEIPKSGVDGIPITDEIEMELNLA